MKLIRLTSGEEIIGKVAVSDTTVTISDAYNMVSTEPGKIGFIPFMAYSSDKQFEVDKNHVLMICTPVDELVDQIRSMTSGIVTPPQQGIITS